MRKIISLIRRAIDDYDMIKEGERIAVGVSGGKDSLTLLCSLKALSKYHPKRFDVIGLTLDGGFKGADYSGVLRMCKELSIEYIVKNTNIKEIVFDIRKETNPCSLCAKMRRGALNDFALENGCKTIALGHHNDDALETFFLSLYYEGRLNCFTPVTYLDRKDVHLIRPMIYVPEKDIRSAAKRHDLPVVHNSCPANGYTQRQYMKDMIRNLAYEHKGIKTRLFTAIQSGIKGWRPKDKDQ